MLVKNLCVVLAFIVSGSIGESYVRVNKEKHAVKLFQTIAQMDKSIFLKPEIIRYSPKLGQLGTKITGIVAVDRNPSQGSSLKIVMGGLDFPCVVMRVCNKPGNGYDYEITIYGTEAF